MTEPSLTPLLDLLPELLSGRPLGSRRSGAPEGEILPLPRCACGGLLRPDVVWFGEALAPEVWAAAAGVFRSNAAEVLPAIVKALLRSIP